MLIFSVLGEVQKEEPKVRLKRSMICFPGLRSKGSTLKEPPGRRESILRTGVT